jgi:hypothetical protein
MFGQLSAQVGYQNFNYLSATTLATQSESHAPVALGASFGILLPGYGYVGANYRYQVAYTAGAQESVCRITSVVGTTTCAPAVVGAPLSSTSNIIGVEARWFAKSFAINPGVTFDATHSVWGVQMPMYVIMSSGGALIGGINPGWRSDTKDLSATFFVGAALDVAPGLPSPNPAPGAPGAALAQPPVEPAAVAPSAQPAVASPAPPVNPSAPAHP